MQKQTEQQLAQFRYGEFRHIPQLTSKEGLCIQSLQIQTGQSSSRYHYKDWKKRVLVQHN